MQEGCVPCDGTHCPGSPSTRRRLAGCRRVSFESFGDIEHILASAVVANWRHTNSLLVLRGCSRAFRDAIDSEIDAWCRRFVAVQRTQETRLHCGNEAYYKQLVLAESMLLSAFGTASGLASKFMQLSIVDRRSYMALLTGRCMLCRCKYTLSSDSQALDSEETSIAPCYVFAHKSCQRKHMVVIADSAQPIQRCAEPRSLHKELCTVSHMNTKGIVIDYRTVKGAMSSWFNVMYAGKKYNAPIVVWLAEHSLVRKQDTLYGALGITKEDVEECLRAEAENAQSSHQQLEQKRAQLAQAKESMAAAFEADLRVWLGKGYTRWRSIEDMDSFHPRFLQSTYVDQFVEPMAKRRLPSNINVVFYMLVLFNETLSRFQHTLKPVMLEWVVTHLGVHTMFDSVPYNAAFNDDRGSNMDIVTREAVLHSKVLTMLANCGPESIKVTECTRGFRWNELTYNAKLTLYLSDDGSENGEMYGYQIQSDFVITEPSLCKFKYIVYNNMDPEMASKLPPVPVGAGESEAGEFLNNVLKACFSATSGHARVHALSLIVATCVYRKIVTELRVGG